MTSVTTSEERGLGTRGSPQKFPTSNDTPPTSQENCGRKKRTFDIAFLTGQSESCDLDKDHEKESNNNNNPVTSGIKRGNPSSSESLSVVSGQTTISCSSSEPEVERGSPYNLSHSQHQLHPSYDYSSDTSSMVDVDVELDVDVMTNGSLSEDEGQGQGQGSTYTPTPISTPTPIRTLLPHPSLKQRASSQTHSRVLLSLSQSHYNNHQNHYKISGSGGKSYPRPSPNNPPTPTSISGSGGSNSKSKPKPSDMNGKKRGKSGKNAYPKNPPVKEEIRFESKRTIDINHSSDSLKIKENLQFSTLIPSSGSSNTSSGQNMSQSQFLHPHQQFPHFNQGCHPHPQNSSEFNEFLLPPHLATTFALFPHISSMTMSKFPGLLPPLHHQHQNQHPLGQGQGQPSNQPGQPSPGIHFSSSKVEKGEGSAFHHQNHNLSPNSNHSQSTQQKIRHFSDIYPGCGGYPYPNLIIHPPQFSPTNGSPMSNQHSPPNPGGSTLLPPSLTALTLPAQNVCAKCNIGFRMTSDLVYHMRSHHKRDTFDPLKKQREEKLKCPVCHESFRERHHLTRHMTAHQDRVDEAAAAAAAAAVTASVTAAVGNSHHGGESYGQSSSSGASSTKLVV